MFGACLLARWLSTLRAFAAIFIAAMFIFGIVVLIIIAIGGEVTFAAVFGFFLILLAFLIILLLWDLIMCLVSSTPPPASGSGSGSGSGMLTNAVDCPTAQQQLADARARVSQLQVGVNAQATRVATAQQKLNTARMALTAAGVALAASFFAPWTLPAAIAGVAAATWYVAQAARDLENELTTLERLANQLGQAMRDLAAAEAAVAQACSTPVPTTPPGTTLTTGTMRQIVRGHGRRGTVAAPPGTTGTGTGTAGFP
jgi:hypothetical protein